MNIVLLSGGSGKRLWPLSNEVRSKQFIRCLKNEKGEFESMIQRVYKQIKRSEPNASIIIATSMIQKPIIESQLNNEVNISIEPFRKDTFPAIALASAYLVDILGKSENDAVVFCPVDPYVDDSFFEQIKLLYQHVLKSNMNISLIGIEPKSPSEKYGYIVPSSNKDISVVSEFKEKPTKERAEELIKIGALWNGGVFGLKIKYILGKAKEILGTSKYNELFNNYLNYPSVSFDYAVVEKEKKVDVIKYKGMWQDIGTWDSLTGIMDDNVVGQGVLDDTCENVHIINELNLPIIALGLNDVVIAASHDGILVSDKKKSDNLKKYADNLSLRPMFEERFWGNYKVLDYIINEGCYNSLTKHLIIKQNKFISYHKHQKRSEFWIIIKGHGVAIINGKLKKVSKGDFVQIMPNDLHSIKAIDELHIIEVQIGSELIEEDVLRFDLDWNELNVNLF